MRLSHYEKWIFFFFLSFSTVSLAVIQLSVGLNPTSLSVGEEGWTTAAPLKPLLRVCSAAVIPRLCKSSRTYWSSGRILQHQSSPANPAESTPCWATLSWGEERRGIVLFPPQQLVGTSAGQICRRLVTSCSWTAAFVLANVPQATPSHVANGGLINPSPFSD